MGNLLRDGKCQSFQKFSLEFACPLIEAYDLIGDDNITGEKTSSMADTERLSLTMSIGPNANLKGVFWPHLLLENSILSHLAYTKEELSKVNLLVPCFNTIDEIELTIEGPKEKASFDFVPVSCILGIRFYLNAIYDYRFFHSLPGYVVLITGKVVPSLDFIYVVDAPRLVYVTERSVSHEELDWLGNCINLRELYLVSNSLDEGWRGTYKNLEVASFKNIDVGNLELFIAHCPELKTVYVSSNWSKSGTTVDYLQSKHHYINFITSSPELEFVNTHI